MEGLAYVLAGRSSYLDGRMFLYALDPASGKVKHSYNFDGPRSELGAVPGRGFEMEGSKADLLSTDGSPMFFPQTTGYLLFADDNDNEPILYGEQGAPKPMAWLPPIPDHPRTSYGRFDLKSYNGDKTAGYTRARASKWQKWIPVRVRAMVRTGDRLFVAGPPDVLNKGDELAAFQGRAGGKLLTIDPADGKTLRESDLQSPPVFDGLIAAQGRLYMSTRDGRLVCYGD